MSKKIDDYLFYLFLISIFFFRIPSFYLVPFVTSAFLTTQAFARVFIVLIFFLKTVRSSLKNELIFKKNNLLIALLIVFFTVQSISIINAVNIIAFLSRYKDIFVSFLAFFVFAWYKDKWQKVVAVFLIAILVNSLYQTIIVLFPDFYTKVFGFLIYQKHFDLVMAKLQQGRIYLDVYDEAFLPLLLLYLKTKSRINKMVAFFMFFAVIIFSYLSNIRSRILMMLFSLFASLDFLKKRALGSVFLLLLTFFFAGFLTSNLMRFYFGFSFFDRLVFEDEVRDVKPADFRLEQFKIAKEMADQRLLGAGLGNYFDNLSSSNKYVFFLSKERLLLHQGAQEFVHNNFGTILAESGYLGFLLFSIILIIFIKTDLSILKRGPDYQKALVISFWSLFIYGFFNPPIPASYQVLFWGIRGLLI